MAGWALTRLLKLARRLAPVEGWMAVLGVGVAALVLSLALEDASWIRGAPPLYATALLSAGLGLALAKFIRHAWLALPIALALGLMFAIMTAAAAWPPLLILTASLRSWLQSLGAGVAETNVIAPAIWVGERLVRWQQGMSASLQAFLSDPGIIRHELQVLALLILVWCVGVWAGWAAIHKRNALVALAPMGVLLAACIFFAGEGQPWLVFFMGALLVLAISLRAFTLRQGWERQQVDYSPEIRLDFYIYGAVVIMTALAFMPLVPDVRVGFVSRTFWSIFDPPFENVQRRGGPNPTASDGLPGELGAVGAAGAETMPRAHLLGSGPDLAERLVMKVSVNDGSALTSSNAFNYRWRGPTYSVYNGRGWENPPDTLVERLGAGEVWQTHTPSSRRPLTQVFEFVNQTPFWLYAAGDAVSADRPFRTHLRADEDAIGVEARSSDYIALSLVPAVTEEQLQAAASDLPDELAPYLALPDTVPIRVHKLAETIADDEVTAYGKARAIEDYLRQIPYSLDVDAPPVGTDVVDYFLFDLRQGYCDYYASAMIVLARSQGLPARLAVGYASGKYDPATDQFFVTEADAHSWPEIYFPDYGWIPFEPTAAQPRTVFDSHPSPAATTSADSLTAELASLRWARSLRLTGQISLPFLIAGLASLALLWWRRERRLRRQAENPWQMVYLRLESWGERLGVAPHPSLTPPEYAERWQTWLSRSQASPALTRSAASAIGELTASVQRRAYAPASARPDDKQARILWSRLTPKLWRLRLANVRLSRRARKRRNP